MIHVILVNDSGKVAGYLLLDGESLILFNVVSTIWRYVPSTW